MQSPTAAETQNVSAVSPAGPAGHTVAMRLVLSTSVCSQLGTGDGESETLSALPREIKDRYQAPRYTPLRQTALGLGLGARSVALHHLGIHHPPSLEPKRLLHGPW